jgi:hypothetical protein
MHGPLSPSCTSLGRGTAEPEPRQHNQHERWQDEDTDNEGRSQPPRYGRHGGDLHVEAHAPQRRGTQKAAKSTLHKDHRVSSPYPK